MQVAGFGEAVRVRVTVREGGTELTRPDADAGAGASAGAGAGAVALSTASGRNMIVVC